MPANKVKVKKRKRVAQTQTKGSKTRALALNQIRCSLFVSGQGASVKSRQFQAISVGDLSRGKTHTPRLTSCSPGLKRSFVNRSQASTPFQDQHKPTPLDPSAYSVMLTSRFLRSGLRHWYRSLLPGVEVDPRFIWKEFQLSESVRVWSLRHRHSAGSSQQSVCSPDYKTLVYLEGSALWNKGYIDWAYKHAKVMLKALGPDWQILVIQHEMMPAYTYAEIQDQVSLAVDTIVCFVDHFSVREQSGARSLPELYFMGYSSGANLLANSLTQMLTRTPELIHCIRQYFMISPVSLHCVAVSEAIEKTNQEVARTIQTRYSKANYFIGRSFMNFLRCLVWRSDSSVNTDVKIHAKLRKKILMCAGKTDTERVFQNRLSKANYLDLVLFEGNHGAWWDSYKKTNCSGPTILKHILGYLKGTTPDKKLSQDESTCSMIF